VGTAADPVVANAHGGASTCASESSCANCTCRARHPISCRHHLEHSPPCGAPFLQPRPSAT
jgi:hypothetical protein